MALIPICLASLGGKLVKIVTKEEVVTWQQTQAETSRLRVREQQGESEKGREGLSPRTRQGGGPTRTLLKISELGDNPLLLKVPRLSLVTAV